MPRDSAVTCPSCWRLQQTADKRWVELQNLRARLVGVESVLADYVWLVTEEAANELDKQAWNERLEEARGRALDLLQAASVT